MSIKELSKYGGALTAFNALIASGNAGNLTLAKSLDTVDVKTKILIASQSNLAFRQQMGILATSGLTKEELKNAAATLTASTADKAATASTISLSAAHKGLAASLGISTAALTAWIAGIAVVSAAFIGYRVYSQYQEELASSTRAAADEFVSASESIDEYAEKYKALHQELTNANTTEERQSEIKQELLAIQTELNDKYGDEYGKINLVTDAYRDQTNTIKNLNKELASQYLNENRNGIQQAEKQMLQEREYSLGSTGSLSTQSAQDIYDIVSKYGDKGIISEYFEHNGIEGYTFKFKGDATQAEQVINEFEAEIRELEKKYQNNGFIQSILDNSSNALIQNNKVLDVYENQYTQALMSRITLSDELSTGYAQATEAVKNYNEALLSGDDQKIQSARKELEDTRDSIDLTSSTWSAYGRVINDIFNQADTRLIDFRNELKSDDYSGLGDDLKGMSGTEVAALYDSGSNLDSFNRVIALSKEYKLSVDDVIASLRYMGIIFEESTSDAANIFPDSFSKPEMIAAINEMSAGFESLGKIIDSISDKDPFDFSLLDDKNFKDTFSQLGESYTDFVEQISNSPKDIKACQSAFDNLLTEWLNSTDVLENLSDGTAQLTTDMLSNMGVANAEEVVTAALAEKHALLAAEKEYSALTSENLANATTQDIVNFISSSEATDIAKQSIIQYYIEKQFAAGVVLDTSSDVEQLISLVSALGGATDALGIYYNALNGSLNYADISGMGGSDGKYIKQMAQVQANAELEKIKARMSTNIVAPRLSGGAKSGGKSKSSGGSGSSAKKDPAVYDWMERRLEVIDSQVDKLQSKIENLVGYKAKNANTDTAIDLMTEKISILQQMYERYNEEASKIGLAQEYIEKVQNGTIDIESISDESLVSQINDFKEWYEKAEDVSNKIDDVGKSIHELNISKLDNIIDQFDNLSNVQSQLISTEEQLLDLREKSGDTIYADDYLSLGEKQLELTRQNLDAYNALAAEMSKQNLEKGSDEWKTYNNQLQEYKNNMISAAEATETYKDSMTDLVYKELDDFKSKMDSINGTISTMNSLIGDVDLIDDSGNLTDRGLAQVALYAQQLANSKQEAANYAEAIDSLEDALDSGLITQDEYNERLYDYTSAQESAVQSTKDAKDAMIALVKEGIQAQIDAKKKLTDETIAALEAEQDLHNYQNDINEKQKNITTLQKKIAALAGATSGIELATRLQLEQELLDAQKELYETQYDHNIEQQKNALNEAYDVYEQEKQDEMDELDSNLSAQEKAIEQYLNEVKNNYSTVYDILTQYGDSYSLSAINDLTSPWKSGSDAAYLCADAMGEAIANINYEISNIDMSPLYELIDALNSIGEYGMGGSSSQFEDVTNQGEWKKSSGRWWYGNSSNDYVSGGIYTIDGKQYGFGDDGYMLEGWNDDTGEWKYFEPGSGVMTRSAWKQDKKGNWYYLDKNGSMATDSVVKAQSGDGYYYLNDDGMWDGETLSYDEIRKRGLVVAYKNGTNRVGSNQLAWTQEEAPEIITRPSDSSMLVPLKADDGVLNGDLTENLMKMATDPSRFIQQISTHNIPSVLSRESSPVNVDMKVNIEGNADEKTVGLMHDMMVDFTKNEMFNVIKKSGYKYRK